MNLPPLVLTLTITSFSSGALVTTGGRTSMNLGTLLRLSALGAALAWLAIVRRRAAAPATAR